MDEVQAAEDRLTNLQWLIQGSGVPRCRSYEVSWDTGPSRAMTALQSVISRHTLAAAFTSSTGIGNESLSGMVGESSFTAAYYSPTDVDLLWWTRVTLRGQVLQSPDGRSVLRLAIQPKRAGLVFAVVSALIGIAVFCFGVAQFAVQQSWAFFGIASGITLALWLVPSGLLWWGIREGRANEREALRRLNVSVLGGDGGGR